MYAATACTCHCHAEPPPWVEGMLPAEGVISV
jgi:hypothetical protein